MSATSDKEKLRNSLTLKNLRRHDDKAVSIVAQSAHAVVYTSANDANGDDQWIKSTVEGPMFLFQRSQAPFYGFMILSTKGLEFVHQLLTPAFDAVSEAGMIMFRASVDEDCATGIWVQDDSDRQWMFTRMEELRLSNPPSPPAVAAPVTANQPLPLDILFASSSCAPAATTSSPPPLQPSGLLLLDSIFKSAQLPPVASSPPVAAAHPPATPMDARALLAMIGHPGGAPAAQSLPAPPASKPVTAPAPVAERAPATEPTRAAESKPTPFFAPPLLSHDLFASAPLPARKRRTAEEIKAPAAAKVTPPAKASPAASLPRETVSPILNNAIARAQVGMNGSSGDDDEPLGKAEFIKAVTAHLSKPAFQMGLYSQYLARFSERMEHEDGQRSGGST